MIMAMNIERLLRMTADYHNFCSNDYANAGSVDSDELTMEELDFVAAATGMPVNDSNLEDEKKGLF